MNTTINGTTAAQVNEREQNAQEYDVKTLPQIAEEVENGNIYYRPTRIKVGSFDSFGDFASYFDCHYRPLLERIQNGDDISEKDRHTLNFLASDLLEAMGVDGETS